MLVLIVIIALVAIVVIGYVVMFNRLVRLRNRTDNSWAQVDVQLRRRYDLIPNLVETVKGYASHERETFEQVVAARQGAIDASGVAEQGAAENVLTGALRRLFALAEDYPKLRASENFNSLQQELSETENRIAVARQIYNDTVLSYNNAVQTVPSNIVALTVGMKPSAYFEIDDYTAQAPQVDL